MAKEPHRLDDKRGSGRGDNVRRTVSGDTDGAGPRLIGETFNDRTRPGRNGKAKQEFTWKV